MQIYAFLQLYPNLIELNLIIIVKNAKSKYMWLHTFNQIRLFPFKTPSFPLCLLRRMKGNVRF